ncbi:MAG: metal-dependent hydrolase [Pseudomonadota bacterium]
MFIGHFAPAIIAASVTQRRRNSPGLATMFIAAQLVDWAFFSLAFFGIEKMRIEPGATKMVPFDLYHLPYTHSLLGTGGFAIAFAILVWIKFRDWVGALLVGLVVLSHWLLDWLTHRPDLTLNGSGQTYGLGLWNYPVIAMPLEIGIVLGSFVFYIRRSRGPLLPPALFLIALLLLQAINWFAPHPEVVGPAIYAQALLAFAILTGFAWWLGENRYGMRKAGLASPST